MESKNAAIEDCRLLDAAQIGRILKISLSTVYRLTSQKKKPIPSIKMGKCRRYPLEKVREWMKELNV